MKAALLVILLFLFSAPIFAAPLDSSFTSNPTPNCEKVTSWPPGSPSFNQATFCSQFAAIAYCHCSEKYSSDQCHRMKVKGIYDAMLVIYHTIDTACKGGQKDVDQATCLQQWARYLDPANPCPSV